MPLPRESQKFHLYIFLFSTLIRDTLILIIEFANIQFISFRLSSFYILLSFSSHTIFTSVHSVDPFLSLYLKLVINQKEKITSATFLAGLSVGLNRTRPDFPFRVLPVVLFPQFLFNLCSSLRP